MARQPNTLRHTPEDFSGKIPAADGGDTDVTINMVLPLCYRFCTLPHLPKKRMRAQMNTLYDLLGVGPDATFAQIELGFRRSLEAHRDPSRERGHLQAIKAAYGVLSSPVRREFYDHKLNARHGEKRAAPDNNFPAFNM